MKVNRSCQRADFGRRILDAKYATMPTAETKAREYAEVAVNMGGAVDMAVVCRECGGEARWRDGKCAATSVGKQSHATVTRARRHSSMIASRFPMRASCWCSPLIILSSEPVTGEFAYEYLSTLFCSSMKLYKGDFVHAPDLGELRILFNHLLRKFQDHSSRIQQLMSIAYK